MWIKYRLRRAKPGWVSEIKEKYDDNGLVEVTFRCISDAHAKIQLTLGHWDKVEVEEPDGVIVVEMVKIAEPIMQTGYVPISRNAKERTIRKFRKK